MTGIKSYHPLGNWMARAETEARRNLQQAERLGKGKMIKASSPRVPRTAAALSELDHVHDHPNKYVQAQRKSRITLAKVKAFGENQK